jgi:hypothetical protein
VKNGSVIFSITSAGTPPPVSATATSTQAGVGLIAIVTVPPSGIASAAFRNRLIRASSSCSGSSRAYSGAEHKRHGSQLLSEADVAAINKLQTETVHPCDSLINVDQRRLSVAAPYETPFAHQRMARESGGKIGSPGRTVQLLALLIAGGIR